MKLVLSLIGSVAAMAPAPGKEAVRSLLEAEVTEARSKQDAGWWGDVPLADAPAESDNAELKRMNELLRRSLEDADPLSYVYNDDVTEVPTPVGDNCEEGTNLYKLALYDGGDDGWEGATYSLAQFVGVRARPALIEEGTMTRGSEKVVEFCLEDGTYAVSIGGGSDDGEIGVQWLPDTTQKASSCAMGDAPCTEIAMLVGGSSIAATAPPTSSNYNQPTSVEASQAAWLMLTVAVENAAAGDLTGRNADMVIAYTVDRKSVV